jgi:DNA polymerase-4
VPVPRDICARKSRDVRTTLEQFTPVVEPASIDEAYMDLSGTETLYRGESLRDTALRIQATTLEHAGIQVSIGGGTTKLVAKLAAGFAKPAGVHIVEPGLEVEFMRRLDLADIPGIGPVFTATLARIGLVRVDDALRHDESTLDAWLGDGRGRWLYHRIRGEDAGAVEPDRSARSMSREETFPRDIDEDEPLETELFALTLRLGRDLRDEQLRARTITVKLRDADFTTRQTGRTVEGGVESDRALFGIARELLATLRKRRRTPARLIGVTASNLTPATGPAQLALFDEAADTLETERDRKLSHAADAARRRFGRNAILPGRLLERD